MKKYTVISHQIRQEGEELREPFIVPTPRAYVVDLYGYPSTVRELKVEQLLEKVQFLRAVLTRLGIGEVEAYEQEYSLNKTSWEKLYGLAMRKQDRETARMMRERRSGDW